MVSGEGISQEFLTRFCSFILFHFKKPLQAIGKQLWGTGGLVAIYLYKDK
jgi:hypothetical protein